MNESDQESLAVTTTGSETAKIYGVVLSVGVVCSLAIVMTYEVTRPMIQRNQIAARKRAIFDVLPGAETSAAFLFNNEGGQFRPTASDADGSDLVFAGFDRSGKLVGLAIETRGMGYQDFIRVLYGYSPGDEAVIGVRVLESRETPGLGDRIETDAGYLSNFEHLDVSLDSSQKQLAHAIEFVKSGKKTSDWQIDGITGATISSRAVAEMLRDSTAEWIPRVHPRLADFLSTEAKE